MTKNCLALMRLLSVCVLFAFSGTTVAQKEYPNRPITFIVPYGPGSGNDVIARLLTNRVIENWGKAMVVVNRPGATGGLAMEATAKAAPDGYTIVIAGSSQIINQYLSKTRYDMGKDFTPVTYSGSMRFAVAVLGSSPAKTLNELVGVAKTRPGQLNYTGITGSVAQFIGEALKTAGNVDIMMIPNKLGADAEADVLSGRTDIWIVNVATLAPYFKSGRIRILGISGDRRVSELPEVPTMDEAGFPTMNMSPAYYILAPTGTPSIVVDALNRELVKALNAKDVKDKLAATGIDPKSSTREEASALLKKDMARWEKVVKNSGIRLD